MNTFCICVFIFSQVIPFALGDSAEVPPGKVSSTDDKKIFYFPSSCPTNNNANGIYTIKVFGLQPFQVLCNSDIAGSGWMVIASRSNRNVNFFQYWEDYRRGFGNLTDNFFIGLEKLHTILISQSHELYIQLEDFYGTKRFARYDEFLIGTETDKYVLAKLGTYVGDLGDALAGNRNMKFSTHDHYNDKSDINCAIDRMGAWWYGGTCSNCNLFGLYLSGPVPSDLKGKGMEWAGWRNNYSFKSMKMMIRPKCSCNH